jgi:hypothetical protein
MKVVAEIVAAVILLVSSCYLAPKVIEGFKRETLIKVDKGIPSLQNFTRKLQR